MSSGRRGSLWAVLAVLPSATASLLAAAAPPELPVIPVCYNYGCSTQENVRLTAEGWREVSALFARPADSPRAERARIREAVALVERLMGEQTPIHLDKAKNAAKEIGGQMDCIDESRNTDTSLRLFEQHGYLKWHRVRDRVERVRYLFLVHWGAQIEDLVTGKRYIVDSWYRDSGEPPYLQGVADWKKARPFSPQDF